MSRLARSMSRLLVPPLSWRDRAWCPTLLLGALHSKAAFHLHESTFSFLHTQGMDISPSMLGIAREREVEGDICLQDLGHGLPLRPGMFDGAISISAVQWLCNAVRGWLGCRSGTLRLQIVARVVEDYLSLRSCIQRREWASLPCTIEHPCLLGAACSAHPSPSSPHRIAAPMTLASG